ncbi:MAG: xanthine dehydrogenase family protein molybdopterin-binding subunit [Saprospiraceae bacterium]|nr:xanthine dehydrogenase family protein molybdopterin-binding subunit [Saprospiraceae bacterium]
MKKQLDIIGKGIPKQDAGLRASGRAVYGQDIVLPGMLYGAILRTEYPSAAFSLDLTDALTLPGVACIITADDVDVNRISYKRDHPVLKQGEVCCIRDEIAAVAAETREIAEEAVRRIKVRYEIRKPCCDPFDALQEDAPTINRFAGGKFSHKNIAETFHYAHGDLEAERARSKIVLSRRFSLPRMTHACLGPSSITADCDIVSRKLTLYSSTQVPFLYQRDMAHALKMPPSDIRIIQPIIGGGFGSKLDMYPFEVICALLSMRTGRPVQIVYSRKEEFIASPTRQPMIIDLTAGVDAEGKFTFREVDIVKDNGAYTSWGATTPFVIMQAFSSLYKVRACRFDAKAVYTNNVFAGSFRGYGNPQATFALERMIDLLAAAIGMDQAEIRRINANEPGEITGQGLHYETCGHGECLDVVIRQSERVRNTANGGASRLQGRYRSGVGFASMLHVGGGAKIYRSDGCGTTVRIDPYGHCTIITGSTEIGQGSETVLAMIASEELGIAPDRISVINSDTDVKPWDVGVHASRTSFVAGNSLLGAIAILRKKLESKARQLLQCGDAELAFRNGLIETEDGAAHVALDKVVREMHFGEPNELAVANFFYEPPSQFQDTGFKGNVSGSYAFAAQAIEVEVDCCTGNVKVKNVWVAQDVGKVLNQMLLEGQIHGGVLQGIGYALYEELLMDGGYIINPNFHNYKLPTASDVPPIHFHPVETYDRHGPYGAKGVGEAPLIPTAAAIANAVSNALGVEISSLPVTPEKVLRALEEKNHKMHLA